MSYLMQDKNIKFNGFVFHSQLLQIPRQNEKQETELTVIPRPVYQVKIIKIIRRLVERSKIQVLKIINIKCKR